MSCDCIGALTRYARLALASAVIVAVVPPPQRAVAQNSEAIADASSSDAAMTAAADKAKATLPKFFRRLAKPNRHDRDFAVKIRFTQNSDNTEAEHIWANAVARKGATVSATITDQPRRTPNIKVGQRVTVPVSQLTDWMFVNNKKFYGAYSLRAVLSRMTTEQAAGFQAMLAPEGDP